MEKKGSRLTCCPCSVETAFRLREEPNPSLSLGLLFTRVPSVLFLGLPKAPWGSTLEGKGLWGPLNLEVVTTTE